MVSSLKAGSLRFIKILISGEIISVPLNGNEKDGVSK